MNSSFFSFQKLNFDFDFFYKEGKKEEKGKTTDSILIVNCNCKFNCNPFFNN